MSEPEQIPDQRQQLAAVFQDHLAVTINGLLARANGMPGPVLWSCFAAAFGNILSEATRLEKVEETLAARNVVTKIVTDQIRKHAPAVHLANGTGSLVQAQ